MRMTYTLGEKIAMLREFCGITRKEMCAHLEISQSRLSEYENDLYEPKIELLVKIADMCQMHPSYFFDNLHPEHYSNLIDHLKYAYYLSELPDEVRLYQKKAIKKMFNFNLVQKQTKDIKILTKSKRGVSHFHKGYFKFMRKKYNLFTKIEGEDLSEDQVNPQKKDNWLPT